MHKILSPSITRWLSLEQCVNRVIEQYEPLKAYFRESVFEDPSKTTEDILEYLNNSFTKVYLEFLSYVLDLLNSFYRLVQSDVPLLYKLKPKVLKILKILYHKFLKGRKL